MNRAMTLFASTCMVLPLVPQFYNTPLPSLNPIGSLGSSYKPFLFLPAYINIHPNKADLGIFLGYFFRLYIWSPHFNHISLSPLSPKHRSFPARSKGNTGKKGGKKGGKGKGGKRTAETPALHKVDRTKRTPRLVRTWAGVDTGFPEDVISGAFLSHDAMKNLYCWDDTTLVDVVSLIEGELACTFPQGSEVCFAVATPAPLQGHARYTVTPSATCKHLHPKREDRRYVTKAVPLGSTLLMTVNTRTETPEATKGETDAEAKEAAGEEARPADTPMENAGEEEKEKEEEKKMGEGDEVEKQAEARKGDNSEDSMNED